MDSYITLAEWEQVGVVKHIKTFYVDGEQVKNGTWYKLEDGELKEVINEYIE